MGAAPPQGMTMIEEAEPVLRTGARAPTLLKRKSAVERKMTLHFRCSKCGDAFLPDAEFCRNCGEERPSAWHGQCYCGSSFSLEEAFCRKCGGNTEAMTLLVKLKTAVLERLKWSREDDPHSCEHWNVNAKLESEFAYMHSLLCNRKFVELVWQEFKDYDTDQNGTLDEREVAQAVPKMLLKHSWKTQEQMRGLDHEEIALDFFRQMDWDRDANVSVDEFLVYTAYFHYLCYQDKVNAPEIFFYQGKKKDHVEVKAPETVSVCCKWHCG